MKRSEQAALKAYPEETRFSRDYDQLAKRQIYQEGYEQAEKDTIERAVKWLKVHAEDYVVNLTGSYPDAPFDAIIGGECWDELKKVMDEDNG